jgi:hypothetical protein
MLPQYFKNPPTISLVVQSLRLAQFSQVICPTNAGVYHSENSTLIFKNNNLLPETIHYMQDLIMNSKNKSIF